MLLKKEDIIERLREKGYTKKDSILILEDVINTITEALATGDDVHLRGFGTFEVREISGREMVEVRSGDRITIPSYKAPKFIAGKFLKRVVKEGLMRK